MRRLQNIIDCAGSLKEPLAIFFADAEKVFDRVDWRYLKQVLVEMRFGTSFLSWIDLISGSQQTVVSYCGYNSCKIRIQPGGGGGGKARMSIVAIIV